MAQSQLSSPSNPNSCTRSKANQPMSRCEPVNHFPRTIIDIGIPSLAFAKPPG